MPHWVSIDSLLAWQDSPPAAEPTHAPRLGYLDSARDWAASRSRHRRRLLVCHDMKGGYSPEDANPDGCDALDRVFTLHYLSHVEDFV